MKSRIQAFTVVEMIAVITIIGILVAIAFLGMGWFQMESRDNQRSSKATVIVESLEKYYDSNGEYPSCSALTASATTVAQNVLVGIDKRALLTPKAVANLTNTIKCSDLTPTSSDDFFAYAGDGSDECKGSVSCLEFVLKYKDETDGKVVEVFSRRNTSINTSGIPNIHTHDATGFESIDIGWSRVPNASNYRLQVATNAAFTSPILDTLSTTNSKNLDGLAQNTQYYMRVSATTSVMAGDWSTVKNATTWNLQSPSIITATASVSQIKVNWSAIQRAENYTLRYSTSSNMVPLTGSIDIPSQSTQEITVSELLPTTRYYFQLQANAAQYSGTAISAIANRMTRAATPTSVYARATTTTNLELTWAAVTNAAGYHVYRAPEGSATFEGPYATADLKMNFGTPEGTRYLFKVYALSDVDSEESLTVSAKTGISEPSSPGNFNRTGTTNSTYTYTAAACAAGAAPDFRVKLISSFNPEPEFVEIQGSMSVYYGATSSPGIGYKIHLQQRCRVGSSYSSWGPTGVSAVYVVPILAQPAVESAVLGMSGSTVFLRLQYWTWNSGYDQCPSGTSRYTKFKTSLNDNWSDYGAYGAWVGQQTMFHPTAAINDNMYEFDTVSKCINNLTNIESDGGSDRYNFGNLFPRSGSRFNIQCNANSAEPLQCEAGWNNDGDASGTKDYPMCYVAPTTPPSNNRFSRMFTSRTVSVSSTNKCWK